jgi:imidazolonepropionase-like amidohydrolase
MGDNVVERTEQFKLVNGGATIGSVEVVSTPGRLEVVSYIDYHGPRSELRETIELDTKNIPTEWRVTGTSVMGQPIEEEFGRSGRVLHWRNEAGEGSVSTDEAHLYIPAETSELATWIYARAAISTEGTIPVLPRGTVKAQPTGPLTVDLGAGRQELQAIVVTGAGVIPRYVLVDVQQRLVAVLEDRRVAATAGAFRPSAPTSGGLDFSSLLIREEFAEHANTFRQLLDELTLAHLTQIQSRIAHRYDPPVRIANVRVFDPRSERLSEPASVTVFAGRITAVQPQADVVSSGDEVVVDGAGGTLLAGLHDMHGHVNLWSSLLCLAGGITTVRDMGNDNDWLLEVADAYDTGSIPGPSVIRAGFFDGVGDFSHRLGKLPNTLDEAMDGVRWYAARGYDFIKFFNSMNPDWIPTLAAEAHRLGMRTSGHIPAFATPDRMIEAGYDEITHVNQLVLGWLFDEEAGADTRNPMLVLTGLADAPNLDLESARVRHTIELMHRHGVGLDTTAVILERHLLHRAGITLPAEVSYLDHLPLELERLLNRAEMPHTSGEELDNYARAFGRLMDVIRLLHEEGLALWPGTDDGTGFTLHRELELYVDAGISPAEVLRIATQDCASHVGQGETHGSIERGKIATFVLLDGDPTTDISAVRRARAVVKNGDLYFPSEIYAELNIDPFCAAPEVTVVAGTQGEVRQ